MTRTHMSREKSHSAARISYWVLFIIAPTAGLFFYLGPSASHAAMCVPAFVVLVMIGEHAFRKWRRIWGLDTGV